MQKMVSAHLHTTCDCQMLPLCIHYHGLENLKEVNQKLGALSTPLQNRGLKQRYVLFLMCKPKRNGKQWTNTTGEREKIGI